MLTNFFTNPSSFWVLANTKPKKIPQGSSTTVYAALLPDVVAGGYYSDCHLETKEVHAMNDDVDMAKKLWDVSVELASKAGVDVGKN
jgi:hypothetical protein